MRDMLDRMIKEGYQQKQALQALIEDMEELRAEMHNRPRQMRGKNTSKSVTKAVHEAILRIHAKHPDLPQHEIARMLSITPARVSEAIAGKRL